MAIVGPHPAAAEVAPPVGQEVTLDGLGIGSQTVYGARGATEVTFPAPASQLSPAGNYVRVFFSHSLDAAAGSSMLIAVNGQPLLAVPLTGATAGGGVVETRIPTALLEPRDTNRLQVRFTLSGPATTLYGRIDGPTAMHYELAAPPAGQPDLGQYPYSLLATGAASPGLGLVLPVTPDARDLGAALRVLADLGRRAASQHVRPQVVTSDQVTWLRAGGTGAVLVGRLGGLPAAPPILEGAGWKRSAGGWTSPGGSEVGQDQGLLLVAISPWDHRTPLLLVTGGTAAAVDRAAAALIGGGGALTGPSVIVSDAAPNGPVPPARILQVGVLSPRDLASFGAGRYRATVGFSVPPVAPSDTAVMVLTVPALGAAVASASVEADVNGSWVAAADLDAGGARPSRIVASVPGRLLRPGRNALSLEFRVDGGTTPVQPTQAPFSTLGAEAATAALSLPDPSPAAGDLRLLPYPFLEGTSSLQVVLADRAPSTLGAAAQAVLALGSRSTQAPPTLRVAFASGWDGSGDDDLLVIGRPPAGSALEAIGAQLPVVFEESGDVTMGSGGSGGRVRVRSSVGAVEEVRTSDGLGRQVLWVSGTGADVLLSAAAALYDPTLSGTAVVVDAAGRLSAAGGGTGGPFTGLGPGTAQVAGALAALLILAVVGLQFIRPRRAPA
jgi:hypothetical protein